MNDIMFGLFLLKPIKCICKCVSIQSLNMYIFWVTVIWNNSILTDTNNIRGYYDILFGCVDILCVIFCHLPIKMLKTCLGVIWNTYNSSDSPSECFYFEWHSLKVYFFWVTVIQSNSILTDTLNINVIVWYIFWIFLGWFFLLLIFLCKFYLIFP